MVKPGVIPQNHGRINVNPSAQRGAGGHRMQQNVSGARDGFSGPIDGPWRKNVSYKQPVTLVHTTHKETKSMPESVASKLKPSTRPAPQQVFWAERLRGLVAMRARSTFEMPPTSSDEESDDDDGETKLKIAKVERTAAEKRDSAVLDACEPEVCTLPTRIVPITMRSTPCHVTAVGNLCAALNSHTRQSTPLTGQTGVKRSLDNNLAVHVNTLQPLITPVVIAEADIVAQEKRVLDARHRLEETLKHFG